MGDLEEAVKCKYLLVDTWDVQHQHILIASFSLLMFAIYTIFLWFLCSLDHTLTTSLIMLGSQIGLGLPATRAYYDFGVSGRSLIKFYDSGILRNSIKTEDLSINIGDIPLVFESMSMQLQKYDTKTLDDLNDLAWFVIIVWSMLSSFFLLDRIGFFPFCRFGAVILIITCIASYISGFRTVRGPTFEENLNHLEYYVDKHVRRVDLQLPSTNGKVIFQLTKKRRRYALVDIIVEFKLLDKAVLEYHLGLSSNQNERFILEASSDVVEHVYRNLTELDEVKKSEWILEKITTQSGRVLRFVNTKKILNIADKNTFILGPSAVESSAQHASIMMKKIKEGFH